jgi:steroid delta-isomerase-like uncharacterized protein
MLTDIAGTSTVDLRAPAGYTYACTTRRILFWCSTRLNRPQVTLADQSNIQTAQENVAAFNARDWARFKATLSPQSVYDEKGTQRRVQGANQVVKLSQGWTQAFPDAKGTVTSAMASGDTVVLELTWEGTHTGPLQGPAGEYAASGKRVTMPAVQVFTLQDGKIKESHHYFDSTTLMQQVGALPTAAGATR